jgi:hypothetical protein
MLSIRKFTPMLWAVLALSTLASTAFAQTQGPIGPGTAYPATSEVSDQKAGSVLIYNCYSSNAANPAIENTRINITNVNPTFSVAVHLFFVDGSNCSPADAFLCLTPNQTATFLASDIDPGVRGYLVAVASDGDGCPINFNYLIGDEYLKLASGHAANLGAEAVAGLGTNRAPVAGCDTTNGVAVLAFSGTGNNYNRMPRVVAVDAVSSQVDANDTMLILNRIAGNLATGASTLGSLFGIVYDDAEQPFSFTFSSNSCQLKASLTSGVFRILGGGINSIIPSGRSGWIKIYSPTTDIGLLGAVINFNPTAGQNPSAFNGGHNLHKLTLTTTASYTIPVFPPFC